MAHGTCAPIFVYRSSLPFHHGMDTLSDRVVVKWTAVIR